MKRRTTWQQEWFCLKVSKKNFYFPFSLFSFSFLCSAYARCHYWSVPLFYPSNSVIHLKAWMNPNPFWGSPLCFAAWYSEAVLALDSILDKYLRLKKKHKTNGWLSVPWWGVGLSGWTVASHSAQVTWFCRRKNCKSSPLRHRVDRWKAWVHTKKKDRRNKKNKRKSTAKPED